VTRLALDDINMKFEAGPTFDVEAAQNRHVILEAFVSKRSNSPVGQEPTLGIKGAVFNLHAQNPWRAVTWYDEDNAVCWLLGVSAHDYKLFVQRDKDGTLAPTEDDYADLTVARDPAALDDSLERFLEVLADDARNLFTEAEAAPNTEVSALLAGTLTTAIYVEVLVVDEPDCADVYVAFRMPPRAGFQLPEDVLGVATAVVLPDAAYDDLDWHYQSFPREAGKRNDEVVIWWRRP
jgi:hypothetical protein